MKKLAIIYVLIAGLFLQATVSLADYNRPDGKAKKHKGHKARRKKDPSYH